MKTAEEILEKKLEDERNFCIGGKYTLMQFAMIEAMEEYANQYKPVSVKPEVKVQIAKERFYTDGTSITGYYAIYDRTDENKTLWIDCPNNYLPIIVKALNSNLSA